MKMTRKEYIAHFKARFIDFDAQCIDTPTYVSNSWIDWLYEQWCLGRINLKDYAYLIKYPIVP